MCLPFNHKWKIIGTEEYEFSNGFRQVDRRKRDTLQCKKCGITKSKWR